MREKMSEDNNGSQYGFGNAGSRYPYYYGKGGRLVLVDNALEAVNKGSTTIGIKTPEFASISSHIKLNVTIKLILMKKYSLLISI